MSYPIAEISKRIKKEGHTGRLRRYVMRKYGSKGFTDNINGRRIKQSVITELTHSPNERIRKEANLAKTYHRINVGKKSFEI